MYTGQCDVEPVVLVSFLEVAKSLQIKGLAPNVKEEPHSSVKSVDDNSKINCKYVIGKREQEVELENLKIPASLEFKDLENLAKTQCTDLVEETKLNDIDRIIGDEDKNKVLLDTLLEHNRKKPMKIGVITSSFISEVTFDDFDLPLETEYKETINKDEHRIEKTKGNSHIQEKEDCLSYIVHEPNTETQSNLRYKYSCEKCDQSFMREKLLNIHAKLHETGKHTCNECNKDCFTYYGMIKHNLTVHKHIDKKYNCEYCPFKAAYKVGVINHKRILHVGETTIDNLRLKLNSMMERFEDGEDKWKCVVCGKISSRRAHMRNHTETHIEGLSYPCNQCGKVSRTSGALQVHSFRCHRK